MSRDDVPPPDEPGSDAQDPDDVVELPNPDPDDLEKGRRATIAEEAPDATEEH